MLDFQAPVEAPRIQSGDLKQASELTSAVWPWAQRQRWNPTPDRAVRPLGRAVWVLSSRPFVAILVVQAGADGPRLQIPLTGSGESPVIGALGTLELRDGTAEPEFWRCWFRQASVSGVERGSLLEAAGSVRPLGVEQSNTSVLLQGGGLRLIAKVFRVLQEGQNPEVELPGELALAGWPGVPRVYAAWDLPSLEGRAPECSAVVTEEVEGAVDGYRLFKELAATATPATQEAFALGAVTAGMHSILAERLPTGSPPNPDVLIERIHKSIAALLQGKVPEGAKSVLEGVAATLSELPIPSLREVSRIHGDLHLGQTLRNSEGKWFIIDFEGEPLHPLSQRVVLDDPLRDVAGMLRSFDYASYSHPRASERKSWRNQAQRSFLEGYNSVLPLANDSGATLALLQIEKALYELEYEKSFRPGMLGVPLGALKELSQPPHK